MPGQDEARRRRRFELLYAQYRAPVLGYILRRIDRLDEAADVLAETFLVAWRRLDQLPDGELAGLWLYGVARRNLANHRRGEQRRTQLADRLRAEISADDSIAEPQAGTGAALAFRSLSDEDRELLALSGWEGLNPGEIGVVLGCSRNAARIRLHRARRRLRTALAATPTGEQATTLHGRSVDLIIARGENS